MPILAENRDRYPADWPEISHRIRFERGHRRETRRWRRASGDLFPVPPPGGKPAL